jgi:hypothetical protein
MLKDGVVLAVICLIAVGGIAAWLLQSPRQSIGAPAQTQIQEAAAASKTPAEIAKSSVVRRKPAKPVEEEVVEHPVITEPAPAAPAPAAVAPHDPPPFPAVEQIATGVNEDAITRTYGYPTLSAVTSAGGHIIQTFVYVRDRGRSATVIRLEDGKVASAFSRTQPVPAAAVSVPRRPLNN